MTVAGFLLHAFVVEDAAILIHPTRIRAFPRGRSMHDVLNVEPRRTLKRAICILTSFRLGALRERFPCRFRSAIRAEDEVKLIFAVPNRRLESNQIFVTVKLAGLA